MNQYMYHSTTNSIDSKDIIQNQSLVLKQQKKSILDLLNELDNLTQTNTQIEHQLNTLLDKHKGTTLLKTKQEGWKILTYIRQLEQEHSLTLSKLNKNQQHGLSTIFVEKNKVLSEQNIEIDPVSFNLTQEEDLELRNRNSSISSTQISTDNDEMAISSCSNKEVERQNNPMGLSGLGMRKTKMGKYKIAETFYDVRSQQVEVQFIQKEDEIYSDIANKILLQSQTTEQLRGNLIKQQITIPHSFRSKIWPSLIGRSFQIPSSYYQHLQIKIKQIDPLSKKLIANDITRTFPQLHFFNESPKMLEDLRRVLQMFQVHNSSIGYVQGMAHLASILLLVFDSSKVFESFNNLIMGWSFIRNLYSFNEKDYHLKLNTLSILINRLIPKLNRKISSSQLQLLMIQWFFSIFSRNFNINVAIKLWDLILIHGQYMFYLISLSILKLFIASILSVNEDEVYLTVKGLTPKLSFSDIEKSLKTIPFTQKDYEKTIQRLQK